MTTHVPAAKAMALSDLERELAVTRKVLDRLPEEHYGWKPHPKSMSLGQLAIHVAYLPEWARVTLASDVLDTASAPRPPASVSDRNQLLSQFDQNVLGLREAVEKFDVARLNDPWTMRRGTHVVTTQPRATVFRIWCINHMIHHRAQLCLYLRLLDVPVPTVYFNTADDPTFVFE